MTDNTDNSNNIGGNGTADIADNTNNTNNNGGTSNNLNKSEIINAEDVVKGTATASMLEDKARNEGLNKVEEQNVNNSNYSPTNEQPDIYEVTSNVEKVDYTNREVFNSSASSEILANNEKSITKIQDLNIHTTSLNQEAKNAQTDKDKGKIEKKVVKIDEKIGKEEVKIDEDVQRITSAKVTSSQNNLELVKSSFNNLTISESTELKQSGEYERKADQLIDEAKTLRVNAASEKDKAVKAEMLKEANSKDVSAANYYDKAADLYVDAAYASTENLVSQNTGMISSDDLSQMAEASQAKSAKLTQESIAHRDSALLAKGDDKIAMLQRADSKEVQAISLRDIGSKYQALAVTQKSNEEKTARNEELLANLSSSDVEAVKTNEAYPEYLENQKSVVAQQTEKARLEGEKKGIENIIKQQTQDLKGLENQLIGAENTERSAIISQIKTLDEAIEVNESRVATINSSIDDIENSIASIKMNQEDLIANQDEDTQDDFEALMASNLDKTPIKKTAIITFEDLISSGFEVPDEVLNTIYAKDNTIKYSDENPIPLNPKYPKGLIYKVQVGAFSKPIPNDVFSGFAPISGEKVGNLVRYRVGYFVEYTIANDAKNEIRGLGYSDAFVVAVYNGERITLAEARNIQAGAGTADIAANTTDNATNQNNNGGNNTSDVVDNNTANNTGNNTGNNTANNTSDNTANNTTDVNDVDVNLGEGTAKTKDADKIKGLYYTVQIGAFSRPIQAADVFNISPLVTKFIGNLYKYSTGIYQSVNDAVVRKDEVVSLGNTDAFVTAYYDGEKISLVKAKQLIAEQGESVFAADANGNLKQLQSSGTAQPTDVSDVEIDAAGEYQVDLGSYKGEIPTSIANAMLMVYQFTVNIEQNDEFQRYYVGNFSSQEDAQKVIDLYLENGVEDVSIVKQGEKLASKDSGVIYKIYLGTYQGEVPDARAITFVDLKDEGVVKVIEDNGDETYYTAEKTKFSESEVVLKKFTSRGVSVAEIKAFKDGTEISLEEAKQLSGE